MSAFGGCEAAVAARTRCGWAKFRECGELLYGRNFPLRLKGSVYGSYVRPAMVYGGEAWCLKGSEMRILRSRDRSMVGAVCRVQFVEKKIYCFDVNVGFE